MFTSYELDAIILEVNFIKGLSYQCVCGLSEYFLHSKGELDFSFAFSRVPTNLENLELSGNFVNPKVREFEIWSGNFYDMSPPSAHIFYRPDALPAAQPTASKH